MVVNIILWSGFWELHVYYLKYVLCFLPSSYILFLPFSHLIVSSAVTSPSVKERSAWFIINILFFFYDITKFLNALLHCSLPCVLFYLEIFVLLGFSLICMICLEYGISSHDPNLAFFTIQVTLKELQKQLFMHFSELWTSVIIWKVKGLSVGRGSINEEDGGGKEEKCHIVVTLTWYHHSTTSPGNLAYCQPINF